MHTPQAVHTDPGLQPERTSMSWSRTAVAMLVVSLVMLRWADAFGPFVFVLIALTLGAALYVVLSNRAAYEREAAGLADDHLDPAIRRVLVLSAAVGALGLGALWMVLS